MNSMPADADVNAQWHRGDTLGAIKCTAIINNFAYCSALWRGWVLLCVYLTRHGMWVYVLTYVVFVHSMGMKECGYVLLSNEAFICGATWHGVVTLNIQKLNITTKTFASFPVCQIPQRYCN